MSDSSPYAEAQLRARLTVLERVVGMMVRESMLKTGKGPQDILAFGEAVKFFSAIASDIGSQDSQ